MNKLMYRFVATRKKKKKEKKKKEIDPFLDTVCPFRASRVINIQIFGYEEKEIVPFLDTVCPLRASRVTNGPHFITWAAQASHVISQLRESNIAFH